MHANRPPPQTHTLTVLTDVCTLCGEQMIFNKPLNPTHDVQFITTQSAVHMLVCVLTAGSTPATLSY